jgi:hypothetical protein
MLEEKVLNELLSTCPDYFVPLPGESKFSDGWKVSIQGRTVEHAVELVNKLVPLIYSTKSHFKIGTKKLIDLGRDHEQSTKLLTIYVPNGVDGKSYAELVRLNLSGYTGAADIEEKKGYIKHAEGIFYRNDRDSFGEYIPV